MSPRSAPQAAATTASTLPPAVSSASTRAPAPRLTRVQVVPPLWVDHRSGPNTQPSAGSAKRTSDTPTVLNWAVLARGSFGAGMPTHCAPSSVVRTKEVHGASWHGAVPNTQPSEAETNVAEVAAKPTGTGPPGGPESTVVEGDAVDGIWALVVVVAATVMACSCGPRCPPTLSVQPFHGASTHNSTQPHLTPSPQSVPETRADDS